MPQKKEKDYLEITPSTIIIALLAIIIIILLVTQFSSKDDKVEEKTENNLEKVAESKFGDPKIVSSSVELNLDESVYLGDVETAKYAIVEFSDFQCPYCQRHATETLPSIISEYVDSGELIYVFNDMPIYPPGSTKLALAGLCIYENAGITEFKNYRELAYDIEFEDDDSIFNAIANMNIDVNAVRGCYDNETYSGRLDANVTNGNSVGMQGVPGFIVGVLSDDGKIEGYTIPGAYPFGTFQEIVEDLKQN